VPTADLFQVVLNVDLKIRPRFTGSLRGKVLLVAAAGALIATAVALFWLASDLQALAAASLRFASILLSVLAVIILILLIGDRTYLWIRRVLPWVVTTIATTMTVLAILVALVGSGLAIIVGFDSQLDEASLVHALWIMGTGIVTSLFVSRAALELTPPVLDPNSQSKTFERFVAFRPFTYWLCMSLVMIELTLAGSRRNPWNLSLVQDVSVAGGLLIIVAWATYRSRVRDSLYRIAEVATQTAATFGEDPARLTPSQTHLAVSQLITSLHAAGNPKILGVTVRPTIAWDLLACLEYIAERHLDVQSSAHLSRTPRFDRAVAKELGEFDVILTIALLSNNLADRALKSAKLYS